MIIYLEHPIVINGIRIAHTKEGLVHLISHYTHMLKMNPVHNGTVARKPNDEEHMKKLVENWKLHLELYDKQILKP